MACAAVDSAVYRLLALTGPQIWLSLGSHLRARWDEIPGAQYGTLLQEEVRHMEMETPSQPQQPSQLFWRVAATGTTLKDPGLARNLYPAHGQPFLLSQPCRVSNSDPQKGPFSLPSAAAIAP